MRLILICQKRYLLFIGVSSNTKKIVQKLLSTPGFSEFNNSTKVEALACRQSIAFRACANKQKQRPDSLYTVSPDLCAETLLDKERNSQSKFVFETGIPLSRLSIDEAETPFYIALPHLLAPFDKGL